MIARTRTAWSPAAGAPSVPAAFALAAGILAGVALPVPTSDFLLWALAGLGTLAVVAGLHQGRDRQVVIGGLVLLLVLGHHGGRDRLLLPARHDRAVARSTAGVPDDSKGEVPEVVEVIGRLSAPWSTSGRLFRSRLNVEAATRGGAALDLQRPLDVTVSGTVEPFTVADFGDRVRLRGPLRLADAPVSRRAPVRLPETPRLSLKSAVQIERLAGPGGILAPIRTAHHELMRRVKANTRDSGEGDRRALSLVLAMLLGETADLDAETSAAFRDGGVAHVLSISGLHVGLLAALLAGLLRALRVSVFRRDLVILLSVLLFAVFANGRPPVMRAAFMIALALLARLLGRPTSPGQVLGLAALVLLLIEPANLFDAGFLLTFAAVSGLSLFGVPLARRAAEIGLRPKLLRDSLAATLGAELCVFPLQAFVFNTVPFVALVSNLVVVPVAGVFLALALVLFPALALSPDAAMLALVPLRASAEAMVGMLSLLDRLHGVRFVPTPAFSVIALLSLLILAAGVASHRAVRTASLAAALVLIVFVSTRPATVAEAGTSLFSALDVGQGDSWLLVSESGRVLVDGGGGTDPTFDFGRLRLLPKLADAGAVSFDAVVLTHPHPDHSRGLGGALTLLPVARFILPRGAPRNEFMDEVLAAASRRAVTTERFGAGERFSAAGFDFEVLHPGPDRYPRAPENNGSLVLKVRLGDRDILLTGDVEGPAERDLVERGGLRADVLKVPHHGSKTSSSAAFLAAVSPRVAMIGVGRRNHFGHPFPDVLARLAALGVRTFRTDRDGDIGLLFTAGQIRPVFAEALLAAP